MQDSLPNRGRKEGKSTEGEDAEDQSYAQALFSARFRHSSSLGPWPHDRLVIWICDCGHIEALHKGRTLPPHGAHLIFCNGAMSGGEIGAPCTCGADSPRFAATACHACGCDSFFEERLILLPS